MVNMDMEQDIQLTPDILAEMPHGLTPVDQYKWRRNKANELRAQAALGKTGGSGTASQPSAPTEAKPAEAPSTDAQDKDSMPDVTDEATDTENKEPAVPAAEKKVKAQPSKPVSQSKKNSSDYKLVRDVHKSVLVALRRLFPGGASAANMITAVVYIITDGGCELSEQARSLVDSYDKRDGDDNMSERIGNIERMLRNNSKMLQSIELCTCYNTFDRKYGSRERRAAPGETEFREQGNLDMLDRLRRQADDQRKVDSIERGREIYNLTKDKNDN